MAKRADLQIFWVIVIAGVFWVSIWKHEIVVDTAHKVLVFLTTRR
jgi:hypothetical protein